MNAHTPTPWTLGDSYGAGKGYAICAGPQVLARVVGFGYPTGIGRHLQSDANAALIVRAVNAHAALVEAIEAVRAVIQHNASFARPEEEDYDDTESAYSNGQDVCAWEMCEALRTALKPLEGAV